MDAEDYEEPSYYGNIKQAMQDKDAFLQYRILKEHDTEWVNILIIFLDQSKKKPSAFGLPVQSYRPGPAVSDDRNIYTPDSSQAHPPAFPSFGTSSSQFGSFESVHTPPINVNFESTRPKRDHSEYGQFESYHGEDDTIDYHSELQNNQQPQYGSFGTFNNQNHGNNFYSKNTKPNDHSQYEPYEATDSFSSDRQKRKPQYGSFEPAEDSSAFSRPAEFSEYGSSTTFAAPPKDFSSGIPSTPIQATNYKVTNYREPIKLISHGAGNGGIYKRDNRHQSNTFSSGGHAFTSGTNQGA